jgi:hypothetical protein
MSVSSFSLGPRTVSATREFSGFAQFPELPYHRDIIDLTVLAAGISSRAYVVHPTQQ